MLSRRSFVGLLAALPGLSFLKPKAETVRLGPLRPPSPVPLMGIPYWIVKEKSNTLCGCVYCRTPQELAAHLAETESRDA
jgi:hypothetical protein